MQRGERSQIPPKLKNIDQNHLTSLPAIFMLTFVHFACDDGGAGGLRFHSFKNIMLTWAYNFFLEDFEIGHFDAM